MLNKSSELFPIKNINSFLIVLFHHCSVRLLPRETEIAKNHHDEGLLFFRENYIETIERFREAGSGLLKTSPKNIAFVRNTTEGMSLLANGYRFNPGDQVIGYSCEYPANYYPWKLQTKRSVEFVELPYNQREDTLSLGKLPIEWSIEDLEKRITSRTKIVAISHVQFTSGFAADLKLLGDLCRSKDIDLIVDVAQSLGSLPVYPEKYNISALASSGWKWLLGPTGTGLLYTSEKFREKLDHVLIGAETMQQGTAYLNHSWDPHLTAKRFEYSTSPISLVAAIEKCITELPFANGMERIAKEIFRLQDLFIENLSPDLYMPVIFPKKNRSGILSLICKNHNPGNVIETLLNKKIVCTERDGFLRFAPHFYNTDNEIGEAALIFNKIGK